MAGEANGCGGVVLAIVAFILVIFFLSNIEALLWLVVFATVLAFVVVPIVMVIAFIITKG